MAIAVGNSATLTDNGTSDWVKLSPGKNKVLISSATWNGTTAAALKYSDDGTTVYAVRDTFSTEVVGTVANLVVDVQGPGYVAIAVTSYGSNAVSLKVNPCSGV